MDVPRKIEQYNDLELMGSFWAFFGGARGVQILGWGAVFMLSGEDDNGALRRRLEERGMTYGGMYRALNDVKRWQEHVEGSPLPPRNQEPAAALLRRLHTVSCL